MMYLLEDDMKHKQCWIVTEDGRPIYSNGLMEFTLNATSPKAKFRAGQICFETPERFEQTKVRHQAKVEAQLGVKTKWIDAPGVETSSI